MLALSRKIGESLILTLEDGRKIQVQVVDVDGRRVRIGIDAPKSVRVLRGEVCDAGSSVSKIA